IRRDGKAFHAFVGGAAADVAADLCRSNRIQVADEKMRRQLKRTGASARGALEFVNIRAVFVGYVHMLAIVGNTNPFRVQAGVQRIAGILSRIERIRTSRKKMFEPYVLRRNTGWDIQCRFGRTINQRVSAVQQRGRLDPWDESERKSATFVIWV